MSTRLFIHEMPEIAKGLEDRARQILSDSADPVVQEMAEQLKDTPEPALSLVFTGQYNAGKSTLIRALTGRADIVIDSDVATNHVREYSWDEVLLIDTPGVQSGVDGHDELADRALRNSDMVVFVVTVDLFDDKAVNHFEYVALDLGKKYSMVLVVNKAGTMQADPQLRRREVKRVAGPACETVPVIITDARDFLEAAEEDDPDLQRELLDAANLTEVAAQLNSLVVSAGHLSRLRRPFELVNVVCSEAMERLTDDPTEKAARSILNRQRRLAVNSRRRLDLAFGECFQDFRRSMEVCAEKVADQVDELDSEPTDARQRKVEGIESEFRLEAEACAANLELRLQESADAEAKIASQEFKELSSSAKLDLLQEGLETPAHVATDSKPATPSGTHDDLYSKTLKQIGTTAGSLSEFWGTAGATALRDVSGSQGHKVVYSVGKALGKNFKPWEAVKTAKTIGRGFQVVNKAMPFVALGVDLFVAIKADRDEGKYVNEIQSRRNSILREAGTSAAEVAQEFRARLNRGIDEMYSPVIDRIEKQQTELDQAAATRDRIRSELAAITAECAESLALLSLSNDRPENSTGLVIATGPSAP